MCVKGKEAERTFSSLVKQIKTQSRSIETNTKTSLSLPGPAFQSPVELSF